MLKEIFLLLSISCALGFFPDYSHELCKRPGLLCKDHAECCSGVCFEIGNIGWRSCIQIPEEITTRTASTTPKIEIYDFDSYNYSCDPVGRRCIVNKNCCSRNCYKNEIIMKPGMCVY
ncbi:uncharacterized protein LOC123269462 [Cotesia glomerata]|uniref:Uncharacterized protein n=1 Tax=Cotesia glomerata TaxID=32391 RepID=A0AAV7I7U6_COTGL|nr:uncharacterized protein LOC123269462 [Cotesia glomerata]KAH0547345.1 hypothetical protein KQX54_018807 [Cotesia glomerata]